MKKKLFAIACTLLAICCAILPCFAFGTSGSSEALAPLIPLTSVRFNSAGEQYNIFDNNAHSLADNDGDGEPETGTGYIQMNTDYKRFSSIIWNSYPKQGADYSQYEYPETFIMETAPFTFISPYYGAEQEANAQQFDAIELGLTGIWYRYQGTNNWWRAYSFETMAWDTSELTDGMTPQAITFRNQIAIKTEGNYTTTELKFISRYLNENADLTNFNGTEGVFNLYADFRTNTEWTEESSTTTYSYVFTPRDFTGPETRFTYLADRDFALKYGQNMKFYANFSDRDTQTNDTFEGVSTSISVTTYVTYITIDRSGNSSTLTTKNKAISYRLADTLSKNVTTNIIDWDYVMQAITYNGDELANDENEPIIIFHGFTLNVTTQNPAYRHNVLYTFSLENDDTLPLYTASSFIKQNFGETLTIWSYTDGDFDFMSWISETWYGVMETPVFYNVQIGDILTVVVSIGIFFAVLKIFMGG